MKASILDLRRRMGDVLKALERNESVTIMHRGKPKAVLQPIRPRNTDARAEEQSAFGMWADHEEMRDVAAFVRRIRKGRVHVD